MEISNRLIWQSGFVWQNHVPKHVLVFFAFLALRNIEYWLRTRPRLPGRSIDWLKNHVFTRTAFSAPG
jgi:hypothetical protein